MDDNALICWYNPNSNMPKLLKVSFSMVIKYPKYVN